MESIEDLPHVPPALLLVVNGLSNCSSRRQARSLIRGILPELRNQSETFEIENINRKQEPVSRRFSIHLHGALDLLSGDGCQELRCRAAAADRIARSVGLIADHVWITDLFTEQFINFGRITNEKIDKAINDALVLGRLMPLIQAGIVKFRSPFIAACQDCALNFQENIENTTSFVSTVFEKDFEIKINEDNSYSGYTGESFEPSVILRSKANCTSVPSISQFSKKFVEEQLRSAFWIAREASLTGGSIFSNSRIGLSGLLHSDGRLIDRKTLLLLDKEREFTLPWVSELNAQQIIELRHEAAKALPVFREKMARCMTFSDGDNAISKDGDLISELREQAAEVRSELEAKKTNAARYWKVTYGLLGLGCSAYGVATDQVVPGIGGLLSVLHLLINHKTGHETDISKLESKPGYVLLKAQDILAHADE